MMDFADRALTTEQLIAVFLAAPSHDLDHRGRSNVLEINEESDIAKAWPDEKGPLENQHVSKKDEFCIKFEELCIENEDMCIKRRGI